MNRSIRSDVALGFLALIAYLFLLTQSVQASELPGMSGVKLTAWPGIPDDANPFEDWPTPPETFVVGDDRVTMTAKQLKDRENAMIVAQTFVILRRPAMVNSADNVLADYWEYIVKAGAAYNIDPWTIAAILWLESQGNPNAESPTGPRGVMQFAAGTARDMGLIVKKCPVGPKKKKKKQAERENCVEVDERLDPEKSIFAAAKLLSQLHNRYGDLDYAIAAYHMGQGAMDSLVKTYLDPDYDSDLTMEQNIARAVLVLDGEKKQKGISYSDIFFRNTPYRNPNTFKKIAEINSRDFGPTYFYRVTCAKILIKFAEKNPKKFAKLAGKQKHHNGSSGKYRFTSWYSPSTISQFKNLAALKKAKKDGDLEGVANGLDGCKLLLKGKNPIAEKDLKNQSSYAVLKPTANSVLHAMCETWGELGGSVEPYVTSLSRTIAYQKALKKSNSNARTALPMHTTGLAFDLWKFAEYKKGKKGGLVAVNYTAAEVRDILFVLKEFEQIGYISFTDTEPGCWHVVIAPDMEAI